MSYENTPHACFRVAPATTGDVAETVPRLVERHLRHRFDSVRLLQARFLPPMVAVLSSGAHSIAMVLGKNKHEAGEWLLIVGPPDNPSPWPRLRRQKPDSNVVEIKRVCDTLHEVLIGLPGVSDVRWYFEGTRQQTPAVATPGELPWD